MCTDSLQKKEDLLKILHVALIEANNLRKVARENAQKKIHALKQEMIGESELVENDSEEEEEEETDEQDLQKYLQDLGITNRTV